MIILRQEIICESVKRLPEYKKAISVLEQEGWMVIFHNPKLDVNDCLYSVWTLERFLEDRE